MLHTLVEKKMRKMFKNMRPEKEEAIEEKIMDFGPIIDKLYEIPMEDDEDAIAYRDEVYDSISEDIRNGKIATDIVMALDNEYDDGVEAGIAIGIWEGLVCFLEGYAVGCIVGYGIKFLKKYLEDKAE